jgi:DNA-binding CsgD family transcriptional regulator
MNQIPDLFYEFLPALHVPENFWTAGTEKQRCLYLATCTEEEFLYATDAFETILGYSSELLYKDGLKWWFSLIHPEDIGPMLNNIFQHCFLTPVSDRLNNPFLLTFRMKHADQRWIWIQETKCIVAVTAEGKNHFILGRFEEMSVDAITDERAMSRILHEEGASNSLLKAALPILTGNAKIKNTMLAFHQQFTPAPGTPMPTKREREILHLIGEGLSTKQIAHKLHVTVNTVETHRRHLLGKMKVKNSMELVRQTSNAFWSKAI